MKFMEPLCNSPIRLEYNHEDLFSARRRRIFLADRHARKIWNRNPSDQDVDILVIGGGIHGFGLVAELAARMGNDRIRIRLVDDQEYLCQRFLESIDGLRQTVLRSPYEHQLAPDGITQMIDFARLHMDGLDVAERRHVHHALASCRSIVPLDVFEGHINHLSRVLALADLCERDKILSALPKDGEFVVRTFAGRQFRSEKIIFATGAKPRGMRRQGVGDLEIWKPRHRKLVVEGGGVTAAHVVLTLERLYEEIEWRIGSSLVFQCSDVPHMYFRTEGLARFRSLNSENRQLELRRALKSSVMPEYATEIHKLVECGKLRIPEGETWIPDQQSDRYISMGFEANDCIKRILPIGENNEKLILCDKTLEVTQFPGAYVSGWAAMDSVGPAAKNIDGVRICAERILIGLKVVKSESFGFVAPGILAENGRLITGSAPNASGT